MAEWRRTIMGMPVTLTVRDARVPRGAARAAFAQLRAIDRRFSPYRAGSDVSRIAAGTLVAADAHPDVRAVLDRCAAVREATGGTFDAFATGRLDPSGLVKGWAGDRAAAVLAAAGVRSFCLDLGGDVVVRGGPWRIGVRRPTDGPRAAPRPTRGDVGEAADPGGHRGVPRQMTFDVGDPADLGGHRGVPRQMTFDVGDPADGGVEVVAVLTVVDGAVATSGRSERGDHLVDPRTGRPTTSALRSATVVADDLETADVWATAAFVEPTCLPHDAAALLIDDGGVLTTPALDRYRPSSDPYWAA